MIIVYKDKQKGFYFFIAGEVENCILNTLEPCEQLKIAKMAWKEGKIDIVVKGENIQVQADINRQFKLINLQHRRKHYKEKAIN